jgi:hypothetical protein
MEGSLNASNVGLTIDDGQVAIKAATVQCRRGAKEMLVGGLIRRLTEKAFANSHRAFTF